MTTRTFRRVFWVPIELEVSVTEEEMDAIYEPDENGNRTWCTEDLYDEAYERMFEEARRYEKEHNCQIDADDVEGMWEV